MKLVIWDLNWAGGKVVVTSNPNSIIESWRREQLNWAVEGQRNHMIAHPHRDNPWPNYIQQYSTLENFIYSQGIKILDITEGLTIDFAGDS